MPEVAFVTGADRGLGLALAANLLGRGWTVVAGQYLPDWPELAALGARFPETLHTVRLNVTDAGSCAAAAEAAGRVVGHVDLLVNNAGANSHTLYLRTIRERPDFDDMHRLYDINALGPLRVVEAFLPLVERSALKRLCFVSSEAGSVERSKRTAWFAYCMSKSALNMGTKILFNYLRPEGFSFRLYHPGWVRSYISGQLSTVGELSAEEAAAPAVAFFLAPRADEDRLALVDWRGEEWPW
jgi:NAD(P)-dependent dehydrogenase (short-subunit alcohol dehydrogenase family)